MSNPQTLERARRAFEGREWREACSLLRECDELEPLRPDDLERLATAAYLAGRDADAVDAWDRAHRAFVASDDIRPAARCAFWIGFVLMLKGEPARGGGWLARAQRLIEGLDEDCVESGYLMFPQGLAAVMSGDVPSAYTRFGEAAEIGRRFGDPELTALARHGQGRALIRMGDVPGGASLLDEAMVSVTSGEVSEILAGVIYCSVIEACQEMFDIRRAREWTGALGAWCDSQPQLVLYRGQCMVHRSEIMAANGSWPEALAEVQRACERLADPPHQPAIGGAFYQRAELHRLRGEFTAAEDAYREASAHGRQPQPGLALLRLAEGRTRAARAAIGRAVDEASVDVERSKLLPAFVEIALAGRDVDAARAAAGELSGIAQALDAPLVSAQAAFASGSVLLADGDPRAALDSLRQACTLWQELAVPYEAARARALIGMACRELGDDDSGRLEIDAARETFKRLGAAPALALFGPSARGPEAKASGPLTPREVEVVSLVASGMTNKEIAGDLYVSEKTVARHLSNIFTKLGISSRAAATAYAYENDLVGTAKRYD